MGNYDAGHGWAAILFFLPARNGIA